MHLKINHARLRQLAIIMLLLFVGVIAAQEQPIPLSADETVTATLSNDNIADVYTFTGAADDVITLTASSSEIPLSMLLINPQGVTLGEANTDGVGNTTIADVELRQSGIYVVSVFASSLAAGPNGTYELRLENQPATASDTNDITTDTSTETAQATPVPTDVQEQQPVLEVTQPPADDIIESFTPSREVLIGNGIQVRLQWNAPVDMNLEVRDPVGNTLYFDNRETPVGGTFGFDANGLCEIISDTPAETATWQPGFLPIGSYEILVYYEQYCPDGTPVPVDFNVSVTVDGQEVGTVDGRLQPPPTTGINSVYLANFIVTADNNGNTSATLNQGGLYPDSSIRQLPAPSAQITANPQPITLGVPTRGVIVEEQDYLTYAFDAAPEDVVSISMTALSGNLDTLVQLVGPNGNLLEVNDDVQGSTNSAINNYRLLQGGTYTVVATRYGKELGGTEGEFSLIVSESTSQLSDALANLALPDGEVEVYLTWSTNADLQLLVRDPVGQAVYDDVVQVASGGVLAANGNANCDIVEDGQPVSYIYWPLGFLRPGIYEVEVWYQNTCNDTTPVEFTLAVVVNGNVVTELRRTPVIGQQFLLTFEVAADGTAQAQEGGFADEAISTLPLNSESPILIQPGQAVSGSINLANDFDLYSFNGRRGQTVTIEMRATSQTLDTNLFLLDPNGVVIASNDDIETTVGADGTRNTNSRINGQLLQTDGEYTIIASRYGKQYGGTVGTYNLTLTQN